MIEKFEELEFLIKREINKSAFALKRIMDIIEASNKNNTDSWKDWKEFLIISMKEQINENKKPSFWKDKVNLKTTKEGKING